MLVHNLSHHTPGTTKLANEMNAGASHWRKTGKPVEWAVHQAPAVRACFVRCRQLGALWILGANSLDSGSLISPVPFRVRNFDRRTCGTYSMIRAESFQTFFLFVCEVDCSVAKYRLLTDPAWTGLWWFEVPPSCATKQRIRPIAACDSPWTHYVSGASSHLTQSSRALAALQVQQRRPRGAKLSCTAGWTLDVLPSCLPHHRLPRPSLTTTTAPVAHLSCTSPPPKCPLRNPDPSTSISSPPFSDLISPVSVSAGDDLVRAAPYPFTPPTTARVGAARFLAAASKPLTTSGPAPTHLGRATTTQRYLRGILPSAHTDLRI